METRRGCHRLRLACRAPGGGAWAGSTSPLSEALLLRPALGGFFSGLSYQLDATGTRARAFPLGSQVAYFREDGSSLYRPHFRPSSAPSALEGVGPQSYGPHPAPALLSENLVLRNLLLRPLKELLATCVTESKLPLLSTRWANESEEEGLRQGKDFNRGAG